MSGWTKELPNEPGYWWLKYLIIDDWIPVHVWFPRVGKPYVRSIGSDKRHELSKNEFRKCEWHKAEVPDQSEIIRLKSKIRVLEIELAHLQAADSKLNFKAEVPERS